MTPQSAGRSERDPDGVRRSVSRAWWAGVALTAILLAAGAWLLHERTLVNDATSIAASRPGSSEIAAAPELPEPRFVGTKTCAGCHGAEHAAWQGSQHDRAMQHATPATVLGDFSGTTFSYAGVDTRFSRQGERFMVTTDGADGALADFEVKYTYGVDPLQQYLIGFPDGRLQALSVAWDTRPATAGGQRWFHLYPDERVDHRDELHWTRRSQNWNFMCADCHSTNLEKRYDQASDTFRTTFSEQNVGCEACHGPGSNHVNWAVSPTDSPDRGLTVTFHQRQLIKWNLATDSTSGTATRSGPELPAVEAEVCAQCHARRAQIAEGYHAGKPLLDHYVPALIESPLYHADGQQNDEVYIWGSFLQSRMHNLGVTCANCHDPHSQKLRAPGNAVCAQCHQPSRFDTPAHHHHAPNQAGSACVDCHMPAKSYMVVDPRRDHSLRIPRPDRTETLGTPNACNACHDDQNARWAQDAIMQWTGHPPAGFQGFAEIFAAANAGRSTAPSELEQLARDPSQPEIVRASAANALAAFPSAELPAALRSGLASPSALVRLGSLQALNAFPPASYAAIVLPLLGDAHRAIRQEAIRLLAGMDPARLRPLDRAAFERAAADYEASLAYNADRPESRTALGTYFAARGRFDDGARTLRETIELAPDFVPAYINLADLERTRGQDGEAESVLREGLSLAPAAGGLHHALGLTLVRLGRPEEGLAALAKATSVAPDDARFAYVYAVALNSLGQPQAAIAEIDRALERHSENIELLVGGALFARDDNQAERARSYASRLARLSPGNALAAELLATPPTASGRQP